MAKGRRPKKGDVTLSAAWLADLDDRLRRFDKISAAGGLSLGPGGLALPDLSEQFTGLKLLHVDTFIPGAFGGRSDFYGNIESNTLAVQYGNYIKNNEPGATRKNRKVFRGFKGQEFTMTGDVLQSTSSTNDVEILNLSSLPLLRGWVLCVPNPWIDDDSWVVVSRLSALSNQFMLATFDPQLNASDGVQQGDWEIAVNYWSTSVPPLPWGKVEFAHQEPNGGMFIHQPGYYKVTYGAHVFNTSGGISGAGFPIHGEVTTSSALSGGNAHTHSINKTSPSGGIPRGARFQIALIGDQFNGFGSHLPFTEFDNMKIDFFNDIVPDSEFTSLSQSYFEKTIYVQHSLDHLHGGPYLKLNLVLYPAAVDSSFHSGTSCRMNWFKPFIRVEPVGNADQGPGFNPYLGPVNQFGGRNYQWWGGGPPPNTFDRQGIITGSCQP